METKQFRNELSLCNSSTNQSEGHLLLDTMLIDIQIQKIAKVFKIFTLQEKKIFLIDFINMYFLFYQFLFAFKIFKKTTN